MLRTLPVKCVAVGVSAVLLYCSVPLNKTTLAEHETYAGSLARLAPSSENLNLQNEAQ